MRALIVVAMAAPLAACASGPESFVSRTPTPLNDAYTCAMRMVNQLGFTVTNADREAGFINAEKQTSGAFAAAFTGVRKADQLRISTYADSDSTAIRVTAGQGTAAAFALSNVSETNMGTPSDSGREAAQAILSACGGAIPSTTGAPRRPAPPVSTVEVDSPAVVVPSADPVAMPDPTPDPTRARVGAWWMAGGWMLGLLTWGALTIDFVR